MMMCPSQRNQRARNLFLKGMTSGKPTDQVVMSWPDADAAAGTGVPAPTEEELLDNHIEEKFRVAIPNLDAGRRSLATPKAMAALLL
eukprot:11348466-Karenia_brevis.AAC.1